MKNAVEWCYGIDVGSYVFLLLLNGRYIVFNQTIVWFILMHGYLLQLRLYLHYV